jgi:ubiquitin thioesterase ZRANB1
VCIDGGYSDNAAAEASNIESNYSSSQIHFLPLVDHEGSLLPVHFLTRSELGNEEQLLQEAMNCEFTVGGTMVARQKTSVQVHLVSQLVDDWLDKYRKLSSLETEKV